MPETSAKPSCSPELIFSIATGFMATKLLFVANEFGLFEKLATGPANLDELARRAKIPRRTLRIVIDALVALGLVETQGSSYRNSPVAETFLSGQSSHDLRPFLRFWNRVSYPAWMQLETVVATGRAVPETTQPTAEDQALISRGIEAVTAAAAKALAGKYDFRSHRHVLDLGGGTGSFLTAVISEHGHLRGTLFEQARVTPVAIARLEQSALAHKIDVVAGDFFEDPIPSDHDVVILANVVHILSPEHTRELLRRLRNAADTGSRLLLVDLWTDNTHTKPLFAALMAGEFLLSSGEGDVYSTDEVCAWLDSTGWRFVDHVPLEGPTSLIIGEASNA